MSTPLIVAGVQMASGPNVNANLIEADRLISEAVSKGAKIIVLPENFAFVGMEELDVLDVQEIDGEPGPIQDFLARIAKKHGIWLIGGTIPLQGEDADKVRAACLVHDPEGKRVARYDKIHLFDVVVPDSDEQYVESRTIEPGNDIVTFDTPCGRIGLAVCYDLRFPELFRQMASKGVDMLAIPSAFTALTGKAHWEVLVRARAIENLCYVVAAAQGGYHLNGRETHGESMVVDPWGVVLDSLPRGSGVVTARVERERLENTRRNFPALQHRRF